MGSTTTQWLINVLLWFRNCTASALIRSYGLHASTRPASVSFTPGPGNLGMCRIHPGPIVCGLRRTDQDRLRTLRVCRFVGACLVVFRSDDRL
ncbi:hypothetical protein QBC32DRAFT_88056 [Pseudoneurospora amorphoporcata]|uniref:Secreted protein n=1 Tax=Pseudoneurospora amorphoporcata TaxID=241081 RepID=A0AAN6P301_9PEZI|nr:hypothetical protein QBC32DRAFT_88056 [Pseudoneurospora amorphoporcata]